MIDVDWNEAEEIVLFSLIFLLAGVAFVYSRNYPQNDALMPMLASGAIILSILLLLIRGIVMGFLGDVGEGAFSLGNVRGEGFNLGDSEEDRITELSRDAMVPRVLMIASYPVLGFLFGLLWATPVFVFAYTVWTKQSKLYIASFTAIAYGIIYIFDYLLNLPIRTGILFGGG